MPYFKDTKNNLHHLDDASYIYMLPEGSLEITDKEAEVIRSAAIPVPPEPIYQELRAAAYPSIAAQLDMQYHDAVNTTTTWVEAIEAVKVAYPKPVEVAVAPEVVVETPEVVVEETPVTEEPVVAEEATIVATEETP